MIASTMMGRAWVTLAALSCVIATRTDAMAECRPTALPSGDPALVRQLSERLAASRIATTSSRDCPSARVRIEQRGEQIHVELTDTFGRTGARDVHDLATAAAIVESWTSQEIDEGSLPPLPELATASESAPVAAASQPWPHGLTAAFESAAASDRSIWIGAAISGCVRVGPICTGALVRGARDTGTVSDAHVVNHDTQQFGALVTIGLPRRLAGFVVTPGVALGYAQLQLSEHHLDAHSMPFDIDYSNHAFVADLHISAAHPIGRHFSVYMDLRGDAAIVRTDLPYGPRTFVRASIGIRLGAE